MIEIRAAVQGDFLEVCNRVNDKTVKAFTVLLDGVPVAIAGVTVERGRFIAFSDLRDGVTAPKMTVWKTALLLAEHIRGLNLPAVAVSQNGKFLESIGFTFVGETPEGKTYKV